MMKRTPFYRDTYSPEVLIRRRQAIAKQLAAGEIALFIGAASTGAFDQFRQYNDFYYLTGTEVPHSYLVIEGDTGQSQLLLEARDDRMERSEGPMLCLDDAAFILEKTGIEKVAPRQLLTELCRQAKGVYVPTEHQEGTQACQDTLRHALHSQSADPYDATVTRQAMVLAELELIDSEKLHDELLPGLLRTMRVYKDECEIQWMKAAGRLTANAVKLAMQCTKAGITEYQLGALAEGVFLAGGASRGGYRPIIATGPNIWNAHYFRNQSTLRDGEMVIMDYAPDIHYYTSDIGRMWPVSGRYNLQQRELYGFIVEYHKLLLHEICPGLIPEEVHAKVAEKALPLIDRWEWSKDIYRDAAIRVTQFTGHCSHTVGMAVHDHGEYFGRPMEPGLAFALDPQMWIPEEQLYIRVEDTVVITETGLLNLTQNAPLELDDVEQVMKSVPEISDLGI